MSVMATNRLLKHYLKNKKDSQKDNLHLQEKLLCNKLRPYFNDASPNDIHQHLLQHGLFLPSPTDDTVIKQMDSSNVWKVTKRESEKLKHEWNGPDVPIFLFPANSSRELRYDLNGISGLAYEDKVFLFISDFTTNDGLKALITHEYNHVCRLAFLNQRENTISLLDSLVLEGLAENAVKERLGKKYLGKWTNLYSIDYLKDCWVRWIDSHLDLPKSEILHQDIMYGMGRIPKWLGYAIGYQMVTTFMCTSNKSIGETLKTDANRILELSTFTKS